MMTRDYGHFVEIDLTFPANQATVANGSQPMRTTDGVIVLMVCSRETRAGTDPETEARQQARLRLTNERLERLAKQLKRFFNPRSSHKSKPS